MKEYRKRTYGRSVKLNPDALYLAYGESLYRIQKAREIVVMVLSFWAVYVVRQFFHLSKDQRLLKLWERAMMINDGGLREPMVV
ncbi:hypothetical protein SISSUDRAFT_1055865 [Sistotremastrum suecicum HHB10207 ss-3]|uniref:Uncharacterized protein n=1 Tax=Sistotremastrum suecicum HHB10207 ss-3 TaxID=1314776 RepID=A0A165XH18_9AGAM|nr:hypothetical protein SISSUDRAFT_1055865 [Sistotremastrum suecicum HHB10207 ss-3]